LAVVVSRTCPWPRHLEVAFSLLRDVGTGGNLSTDVQLAAFALEYDARVYSNDTDFALPRPAVAQPAGLVAVPEAGSP
jgi:predicted nucleic acid-binding protein